MNYKVLHYIVGCILKFEGLFMLLPSLVGAIYGEYREALGFIAVALLCEILGFVETTIGSRKGNLYVKEGFAAVSLGWIVLSLFGCLPFVINGEIPHFTDALFETVSGFTTTGASILNNVEALSHAGLFWRSFTHWIGGMGVFVFIMAILPMMGGSTMNLMKAESTGPSVGKLLPKVRDTAKILYTIYIALTIIEAILLLISGMPFFDSITLTFGTVGTGGFGVRNSSIADYSHASQIIITVFMIISGINYSAFFLILSKHFKEALKMEEVRCYLGIVAISGILIAANIYQIYENVGDALRHAFFQVGSIISTTGYATTDFDAWPAFSKTILLLLMFTGACAGSTAGGFKISRVVILFKTIRKELSNLIHPQLVKVIKMDDHAVKDEVIRSTNVFTAAYFIILLFSLLLLSIDGYDITTNFTTAVTMLNNVGPGFNLVGPTCNYSFFSDFSKFVMIFDMLAGRLEIYPMLIFFHPACWKKY
ncbi:MAG: TrkH family potassium uptake protein [Lachnospiraceae bacterium]|nr:TrkH family potassium uptake protein [Lachnospiraceae bacterium]